MAEFVFISPGVKFRERDLTFVTRNVGVTTLGLVGETQKGPAFEPIFVQDSGIFETRFGSQSIEKLGNGDLRYQTPYNANAYLAESNQLWVTRVLGLSGYEAGTAWAITLSAGVDLSTTGGTGTTTGTSSFTGGTYLGVGINQTGDTGVWFTGFTKVSATDFTGTLIEFTATTYNAGSGDVFQVTSSLTGASYTQYEDMVLAEIRSRGYIEDVEDAAPITHFDADGLTITANNTNTGIGDLFGNFNLTATNSVDSTSETYEVSLNPNSRDFITNVLGSNPKGKNTKLWIEAVYPDLIKKLDSDGLGYGVNTPLIDADSSVYTDYREQYQIPETGWIVSELRGSEVELLFKFISISDGDDGNKEIKISLQNIDPVSGEFDVLVRDFNDTDENVIVLESFTRCTMRRGETNYVGQRIGTSDNEYTLQSEYIMLELDVNHPNDAFPAGFEGFYFKDWATSATTSAVAGIAPAIFYKTGYTASERINRVYLGISENGYDGVGLVGTGINQNMYNYKGQEINTWGSKTKGFHMDSGATGVFYDGLYLIGEFEVGAGKFQTAADITDGDVYGDIRSRKFTLVPSGGFDGWDENRNERSYGDLYRKGGIFDGVADGVTPHNDFQAWETAIRTFANPEETTINLFATPGINWSDENILVKNTVDMIEQERADSLYIIDAPDINIDISVGEKRLDVIVAEDIVDLLDVAFIDSSYSCTYYPWIQIRDSQNNVNVWLPPTSEVLKAIAFTDNSKFPWFAPAGLQRGVTDARKSKYKMSQESRDILYDGRINPMADFADVGTAIFGQKTLQVRESALDRINVRRLLLQIEVLISNIAKRLLFEQNDQATIDQFLSKANPVLDTIRRERGLTDFRIKMDDSNNTPESRDRNELYGEIFLKPTRAVEFIGLTFTITPTGASFDEVGA
jgi:hypothetical protein